MQRMSVLADVDRLGVAKLRTGSDFRLSVVDESTMQAWVAAMPLRLALLSSAFAEQPPARTGIRQLRGEPSLDGSPASLNSLWRWLTQRHVDFEAAFSTIAPIRYPSPD